jgi:hypothetical protein
MRECVVKRCAAEAKKRMDARPAGRSKKRKECRERRDKKGMTLFTDSTSAVTTERGTDVEETRQGERRNGTTYPHDSFILWGTLSAGPGVGVFVQCPNGISQISRGGMGRVPSFLSAVSWPP